MSLLRLRGTFIDVCDHSVSLTPRALSEPRQVLCHRPESEEEKYTKSLERFWAQGMAEDTVQNLQTTRTPRSSLSHHAECQSSGEHSSKQESVDFDEQSLIRLLEGDWDLIPCSAVRKVDAKGRAIFNRAYTATYNINVRRLEDSRLWYCDDSGDCRKASVDTLMRTGQLVWQRQTNSGPNEVDIWKRRSPESISEVGSHVRLNEFGCNITPPRVTATIGEIPQGIEEELQKISSHVAERVQSEIRFNAVRSLEAIPAMVQNLLEAEVIETKARVSHMLSKLHANMESCWQEKNEKLFPQVSQKDAEETSRCGSDATEDAGRTHDAYAKCFALASFPGSTDANRKEKLATDVTIEDLPTDQVAAVGSSANLKTADPVWADMTDTVKTDDHSRPLRTCAKSKKNSNQRIFTSDCAEEQFVTNPGSKGHPELCARPCLYFLAGTCTSGDACGHCHMPHSKRPVRFSKRVRQQIKLMPLDELLELSIPILKTKVQSCVFADSANEILRRLFQAFEKKAERSLHSSNVLALESQQQEMQSLGASSSTGHAYNDHDRESCAGLYVTQNNEVTERLTKQKPTNSSERDDTIVYPLPGEIERIDVADERVDIADELSDASSSSKTRRHGIVPDTQRFASSDNVRRVLRAGGLRPLLTTLTARLSHEDDGSEAELFKSLLREVNGNPDQDLSLL